MFARSFVLAAVLALLPASGAGAAEADAERARKIVSGRCFLCHGMSGESSSEVFPRLATQNATYLAKQLRDFQSGRRKGSTMNDMVAGLNGQEIAALGTYFAAQKADPHPVSDAALAEVGRYLYARGNPYSGVAACATCHGPDAHGTETLPRLAGQQARYLEGQLRQFDKRERTNDNAVMHAIATKLTELEVKALAEFLASAP
ncbi:MAG: cytochrome c [Burkholderiales bacterium]